MSANRSKSPQKAELPMEDSFEIPKAVKGEMLKLMMREREEVAQRLLKLDYWIWVLEEFFRAGGA